jgi:hypothetical protein
MLDIINPYNDQYISKYLSQTDRYHLLFVSKLCFERWIGPFYENESFTPDSLIGLREKYFKYILKIKNIKHTNRLMFFENIQSIIFNNKFDKKIERGDLPSSLKSITFGNDFDNTIEPGSLSNIKSLKLQNFNQILLVGTLPNSLERLSFLKFNQMLKPGVLPNNLLKLSLADFSQQLKIGVFPESLIKLSLGHNLDHTLEQGVLPSNLKHLSFVYNFNQKLEQGVLPNNLKKLLFGYNFNQELGKGVLPNNLKKLLIYGGNFNKTLVLPDNLKTLSIDCTFNNNNLKLPSSLKSLHLNNKYYQPFEPDSFPDNLEILCLGSGYDQIIFLPKKLKLLSVYYIHINQKPDLLSDLINLQYLILEERYDARSALEEIFINNILNYNKKLIIIDRNTATYRYESNIKSHFPDNKIITKYLKFK